MKVYIEVEVTFLSGKFASRAAIVEALVELLGDDLSLDESEYSIDDGVEYVPPRQRRKKRSTAPANPQAASGTTARGSNS